MSVICRQRCAHFCDIVVWINRGLKIHAAWMVVGERCRTRPFQLRRPSVAALLRDHAAERQSSYRPHSDPSNAASRRRWRLSLRTSARKRLHAPIDLRLS
jgi:hypothetical protein